MFLCLSRMALDYLSIPGKLLLLFATWTALIHQTATSVAVECVFSRGHLMLSHVHNKLTVQSARALLCLGDWSRQGFVKTSDLNKVAGWKLMMVRWTQMKKLRCQKGGMPSDLGSFSSSVFSIYTRLPLADG